MKIKNQMEEVGIIKNNMVQCSKNVRTLQKVDRQISTFEYGSQNNEVPWKSSSGIQKYVDYLLGKKVGIK